MFLYQDKGKYARLWLGNIQYSEKFSHPLSFIFRSMCCKPWLARMATSPYLQHCTTRNNWLIYNSKVCPFQRYIKTLWRWFPVSIHIHYGTPLTVNCFAAPVQFYYKCTERFRPLLLHHTMCEYDQYIASIKYLKIKNMLTTVAKVRTTSLFAFLCVNAVSRTVHAFKTFCKLWASLLIAGDYFISITSNRSSSRAS